MGLPKQVEEAANLAEELHGKMFPKEQEEQEEVETEEEAEQEKVVEEEAVQDDTPEEKDTFEARYKSLKGKYDAEVPRLHQELKELKQSIFDRLGNLETKKEQVAEVKAVNEKLEKFREDYGDDLIDYLREFIKEEVTPMVQQNISQVKQKVDSVEETQVKAAQESFMAVLDGKVEGDWRKLWAGEDEGFVEFLSQPDPHGLYTYGELVEAYNNKWDADRLATVFNTYLSKTAQPVQREQPKKPSPANEAMVAPSRKTPTAAPRAEEKRIWTQESMKEFQVADRQGKYDPETSKAMWEDLLSAVSENRIR